MLKNHLNYHKDNVFKRFFRSMIKNQNESIENTVIRDIRNLFEHEEDEHYYKPLSSGVIIILNTKVTVIETKHYQLKKIKLNHI